MVEAVELGCEVVSEVDAVLPLVDVVSVAPGVELVEPVALYVPPAPVELGWADDEELGWEDVLP